MKKFLPLFLSFLFLSGCTESNKPNQGPTPDSSAAQTSERIKSSEADEITGDNATPMAAIRNFFEGIANGDDSQAKSALIMNEQVEEYLMSNIRLIQAMDNFAKVDNQYFGAEGALPVGVAGKSMLDKIEGVEAIMIDDTHAQCTVNPPNAMKLTKFSDGWKIDFTGPDSNQLLTLAPKTFGDTAKMFDEVRTKIEDGTITSRAETRAEMKRLKQVYGL